jgi:hypothetical protein
MKVGLKDLRKQVRLVDKAQDEARSSIEYWRLRGDLKQMNKCTKEADLLEGLANFLSLLNQTLESRRDVVVEGD